MGRARIIADLVGFSTDSGVLNFGADKEITLTHDPDDGLILKHAATADDSFPELTFQTGDTDIAVNDLLGRINFQAPDEGAGTDAILVAGAIAAISEGDFSSSANATSLIFQTGASETATTKMTLSSGGNLDVTGDITGSTLNADGDTAAGDNAAIGFTSTEGLILTGQGSTNDVTIKNDADADVIEIPTGTVNVTMAGDASIGDDLLLLSDAAVLNFGADSEIKLTHVHNTGLLLTDSGGTPTLQFHDANESISSDGGHLIFTSNGVAFDFPSADGSDGQVLKTDGSGVLSFVTASANTPSSADGQALGSASLEWSDLFLADAGTIQFGNDQDVILTHVADTGLLLNAASVIQFRDSAINIGSPADGDLDINADDEIELNSTLIDINGNVEISGTAAIVGIATFTDDIIIGDGKTIGSASDVDAIAIGSDGDVTLTQDLELQHDGAILSFGANDEIALTHVHDTGLLLTDSGGTPTLQLHDSNESIASDGSKVIITSGGTAFSLPTSDGSNGQALATNGSGVLSFIDVSSAADDLTAGDAAINLTTTSGNITIDAQAGDSDIIFKGTDGSTDTTFLTIDGSDGGKLLPNNGIDLNGKELILDADADTSITADTDDKIDFRIGGADVMQMNATAFSGGAIYENADDIAANYSITAGKNAMSVGPITIADSVTVTVPSGQRWVIL